MAAISLQIKLYRRGMYATTQLRNKSTNSPAGAAARSHESHSIRNRPGGRAWGATVAAPQYRRGRGLLALATQLLPAPLAGQGLLRPALVSGLQVEAVLLDVLDDVFLLDLALEAPEGVLDRLALLHLD